MNLIWHISIGPKFLLGSICGDENKSLSKLFVADWLCWVEAFEDRGDFAVE